LYKSTLLLKNLFQLRKYKICINIYSLCLASYINIFVLFKLNKQKKINKMKNWWNLIFFNVSYISFFSRTLYIYVLQVNYIQ